jgi:integrase
MIMDGRRPEGKPRMKYFSGATKKEVRALLDRWKADKTNGLDTSAQYTFTDWSNLWFEHHKINITPTPKSRDSYRDVPVPDCIRPYAIALRETAHQYIWQSPKKDDTPCNPSYFRDGYKKAIGTVEGVRYLSPHSCRHTFVSQMQALGVDIATIQTIVGHADIDMTNHYLHVQESVKQDAIEKFSNFFGVPNTRILVEQPCALF